MRGVQVRHNDCDLSHLTYPPDAAKWANVGASVPTLRRLLL